MMNKREANEISTISPHKTKPQRAASGLRLKLMRVISFIIALTMLITLAPVTTYAKTEVNVVGDDIKGSGSGGGGGGGSGDLSSSGWLVYVVRKAGACNSKDKRVGTPIWLSTSSATNYQSALIPRVGADKKVSLKFQLKGEKEPTIHRADKNSGLWGAPFAGTKNRALLVRDWMLADNKHNFRTDDGELATNAEWFIWKYLAGIYDEIKIKPEDYYLVLEPCVIYEFKGVKYAGNNYGWSYNYTKIGYNVYKGDPAKRDYLRFLSLLDLPAYRLAYNWKGLPAKVGFNPEGHYANDYLNKSKSWGMMAVKLSDVIKEPEDDIQSTRKENFKDPHRAPEGDIIKRLDEVKEHIKKTEKYNKKAEKKKLPLKEVQSLNHDIVKDYRTIYTITKEQYEKYGFTAEEVYLMEHPKAKKAEGTSTKKGEYEVISKYKIAVKDASRLLEDTVQKIRIEQEKSKKSTGYNVTKYVITNKNVDTKNNTYENTNIKDGETWVSSVKNIAKAQGGKYLHKSKDGPLGNKDSIVRTITEPEEKGGGGKTAKSLFILYTRTKKLDPKELIQTTRNEGKTKVKVEIYGQEKKDEVRKLPHQAPTKDVIKKTSSFSQEIKEKLLKYNVLKTYRTVFTLPKDYKGESTAKELLLQKYPKLEDEKYKDKIHENSNREVVVEDSNKLLTDTINNVIVQRENGKSKWPKSDGDGGDSKNHDWTKESTGYSLSRVIITDVDYKTDKIWKNESFWSVDEWRESLLGQQGNLLLEKTGSKGYTKYNIKKYDGGKSLAALYTKKVELQIPDGSQTTRYEWDKNPHPAPENDVPETDEELKKNKLYRKYNIVKTYRTVYKVPEGYDESVDGPLPFNVADAEYQETVDGDTVYYMHNGNYMFTPSIPKIKIENEQDASLSTGYITRSWVVTNSNSNWENVKVHNWASSIKGNILKSENEESKVNCTLDLRKIKGIDQSIDTNTLYILYQKVVNVKKKKEPKADFRIPESSLTKRVRFSDTGVNKENIANSLFNHAFEWNADAVSQTSCSGHSHTHWDYSGKHPVPYSATGYCSGWKWIDDKIQFSITNSYLNSDSGSKRVVVQNENWQNVTQTTNPYDTMKFWWMNNRSTTESDTKSRSGWDYVCTLYRGDDKLTLADWKNSFSADTSKGQSLMLEAGFMKGNTPKGTRKTADYTVKFNAKFTEDDDSLKDLKTVYGPSGSACNGDSCSDVTSNYKFNDSTSLGISGIKVLVETYSGEKGSTQVNKLTNGANGIVESGKVIFYPYIKMKYDILNSPYSFMNANNQTVSVLGQYKRTMKFYDKAEVSFENDPDTVKLISNQWSTHNSVNDQLHKNVSGVSNNAQVLPGGANCSLTTNGKYKQVAISTYQCYLSKEYKGSGYQSVNNIYISEGNRQSGETQVTKTSSLSANQGNFTKKHDDAKKDAEKEHKNFKDDAVESLKKCRLIQYTNFSSVNMKDVTDGENGQVWPDETLNALNGDCSLSTDSKYYFHAKGSNKAYSGTTLDVNVEKSTATNGYTLSSDGETLEKEYTFRTDTDGNIIMAYPNGSGSTLKEIVIVPHGKNIEYWKSIKENNTKDTSSENGFNPINYSDTEQAVAIDQRTGVVTQLIKGLERNTGNDDTAGWGTNWYNEAFDGITVLQCVTLVDMGLIKPAERVSVSDPKLIPDQDSKADTSGSGNDYHVEINFMPSQYRTYKGSEPGETDQNYLGTFKGQDVNAKDLSKLLRSQTFYIPNMTTQDLR